MKITKYLLTFSLAIASVFTLTAQSNPRCTNGLVKKVLQRLEDNHYDHQNAVFHIEHFTLIEDAAKIDPGIVDGGILAKIPQEKLDAFDALSSSKVIRLNKGMQDCFDRLLKNTAKNIDVDKLKALMESGFGDVLEEAAGNADHLNKIIARMDMPHFNGDHINQMTVQLRKKFQLKKDFLDDPNWFDTFDEIIKSPLLVESWEHMYRALGRTSQFSRDIKTLEKISSLISDGSDFKKALGNNWSTALDDILKNASDLKCPTCTSGRIGRSSNEQYLGDVEYFVSNFNVQPGGKGEVFYNWMRGLTNPNAGQLDELHQTIKDFAKRGIKETDVIDIGKQFPVGSKKYDLRRIGDKYTEYKNKDFVTYPIYYIVDDIDQFINGYLKNIANLTDLEWKAGLEKLTNRGWTESNALRKMKEQWKKVFENKADELYKPIEEGGSFTPTKLEELFGTSNKSEFIEILDDLDDQIYDFIKVE